MADQYSDFAFAKLSADVAVADATIVVDDVTQLSAVIDGDYYLTISSTLVHPPTFEIVKLTGIDTGSKTLSVLRAQDGTTAQAHTSGTFIKGALTSAMLRRVRSGQLTTRMPTANSESEVFGERYTSLATGRTFQRSPFNAQFNSDNMVDSTGLLDIPTMLVNPRQGTICLLGGLLPWTLLDGSFASTQAGVFQYAYPVALTNGRAAAILDIGSTDYAVSLNVSTGATGGASDARMIFSADSTGKGYELSMVPGDTPKIYDPSGTLVGSIIAAVVPPDTQGQISLVVRDKILHVWYDAQGNGQLAQFSTPMEFEGSFVGFSSNVSTASEPGLSFSGLQSYNVVSRYLPSNYGMSAAVSISYAFDDPTYVHFNQKLLVDPVNAIGVFGTITPPTAPNQNQSAMYHSGAVDDIALLLWAQGGRTLDERVAISLPIDTTSDFGLWLRGTADGQTGLYLQFTYGSDWRATLWLVEGGVLTTSISNGQFALTLPDGSMPQDEDSGFGSDIIVRVVMEDDDLSVYVSDSVGDYSTDYVYMREHLSSYSKIEGDTFGFMLRNAAALADTTLGVRQIGFLDMGIYGGVRSTSEPIYGFGPPGRTAALGTIYIDLSTSTPYLSIGLNPYDAVVSTWLKLHYDKPTASFGNVSTGAHWQTYDGNPYIAFRREGDRIWLHGSVVNTTAGTGQTESIIGLLPEMKPLDPQFPFAWPCVHQASDGTQTIKPVQLNGINLISPQYVNGEIIYLDSISWPAT